MKGDRAAAKAKPEPLTTRPLTPADWPLVEKLFGPNGACGGCWCMTWRVPKHGKAWELAKGEPNRQRFKELVESGEAHGVFAFAGEECVGWCSFGPRRTFPKLLTHRALQTDWDEGTWSIVCFYIPSKWRGRGVATTLLKAATEEAFARGARRVEGYPAVPYNPVMPAAFAWTGVPALFKAAGYKELKRDGATRPVFVKDRSSGSPTRQRGQRRAKP
jgi:GNAT superfamily N-acetyltransferase